MSLSRLPEELIKLITLTVKSNAGVNFALTCRQIHRCFREHLETHRSSHRMHTKLDVGAGLRAQRSKGISGTTYCRAIELLQALDTEPQIKLHRMPGRQR